jgi:hypothetical protein
MLVVTAGVAAACAVRLGGPSPVEFSALALLADPGESASSVSTRIVESAADIVLLSADRDSAWFRAVSEGTALQLSGPGKTGPSALAFYTRRLEILGDTSIVLGADDGSRIHMHDALYEISEGRLLDLMLVRAEGVTDVSAVVRALLAYEATDVSATATIVMGVESEVPAVADSIVIRLRAAFGSAAECVTGGSAAPTLRLLYRPPARIRCLEARVIDGATRPILARLLFGR